VSDRNCGCCKFLRAADDAIIRWGIYNRDGERSSVLTGELGPSTKLSAKATSMIGLCQEGKSSPDALRRSAGTNLFASSARVLACRPGFLSWIEPDFHLLSPRSASGLGQKIELVFSCQSRNLSTGASGADIPVGLTAGPLAPTPQAFEHNLLFARQ